MAKGRPIINKDRCKGCGLCIKACPEKILKFSDDTNIQGVPYSVCIDEDACIGCSFCAISCPDSCIEIYREVADK